MTCDHIQRRQLAESNTVTLVEQWLLSKDSRTDVRLSLAANPSTSNEVLISMVYDKAAVVRHALASRSDLPINALLQLSADKHTHVQSRALQTMLPGSNVTHAYAA